MDANRLKTLREQRGLTQKGLGDRIGVTQAAIARYETQNRGLTAAKILKLATALSVQPGEILAELPATGADDPFERRAIEIVRRLRPAEREAWLIMGTSLGRDKLPSIPVSIPIPPKIK